MKHALEISGMRLLFGERLILSDVYLKIETGGIVGLLGRNGEGKSCLMRGIYGTQPCEKSVKIDDTSVYEAYKNPCLMRYLPQHHYIPKWLSLKRVFLDFSVGFTDFAARFPEFRGSESTKIGHLSGGMHRLVELYVIIKSDTKFVLLDEPFTHISPIQIEKINEIIDEERPNKGFLITDHIYRHIFNVCDRVLLLSNGKTRFVNENDDLKKLGYLIQS